MPGVLRIAEKPSWQSGVEWNSVRGDGITGGRRSVREW